MKTNRFINIKVALFIAVSVLMAACTIEDADQSVEPKGEKLSVEESVLMTATQTEQAVSVKSDVGWDVSIEGGWSGLTVSPMSGTGDGQITIHTDANTTRQGREATISITTKGGVNQKFVVNQSLSDVILEIAGGDGQSLEFEASPEDPKNFSFSCNTTWEVTASDSWIHCYDAEGNTKGGKEITTTQGTTIYVIPDEIQTDVPREGTITISAENGAKTKSFTIKQEGKKIELSVSPTNFEVVATGEKKTIQITCNADWKLQYDNGNILCDITEGTGSQDVEVTCLPNNVNRERQVSLTVISGIEDIKTQTVTFTQAAATPPVLTGFVLIESSVTKNEAEFQFTFESMYPIEKYGIKIWENSESQQTPMDPAINTEGGITKLIFKATKLKSMTTYHVYGYIENTVGKSDCRDVNIADIIFTTAGVRPDDGDNPVPNLSRRKK